jgi:hypothetical protein
VNSPDALLTKKGVEYPYIQVMALTNKRRMTINEKTDR